MDILLEYQSQIELYVFWPAIFHLIICRYFTHTRHFLFLNTEYFTKYKTHANHILVVISEPKKGNLKFFL